MSLANGRPYLAIPGPSTMPDRVLRAMHQGAPNIYEGPLVEMVESLWPDLRAVAGTTQNVAMYIANGHGVWEAANANLFSRGDKALVLATGRFGLSWAESARAMGVEVEVLDFGKSSPVDPDRAAAALRADPAGKIKAVLTTQVDTASTVRTDVAGLRAVMDAVGHPALLAVDCIASLGCDAFHMDSWGVDVMVAASQKGLMVPPGLGFVWFSEKARAACRGSDLKTPYWDWTPRADASPDEAELIAHCKQLIGGYKCPRSVTFAPMASAFGLPTRPMPSQAKKRIQFMMGRPAISSRQVRMARMGAMGPPGARKPRFRLGSR